jgi:hypothetical protein
MKWPGAMFTCIKQLVCCFRPLAEIQNSSIIWHILKLIYLILGKTQHFSVPFTGFNTRIEPIQVSCRVKWSMQAVFWIHKLLGLLDPDPVSQRYGSGIGSGSCYNQQKIVRKTDILLFCDFFCKCNGHWWKEQNPYVTKRSRIRNTDALLIDSWSIERVSERCINSMYILYLSQGGRWWKFRLFKLGTDDKSALPVLFTMSLSLSCPQAARSNKKWMAMLAVRYSGTLH